MEDTVTSTKISTGISGLDELFYGGLRLPDPKGYRGICIAIYGNRGISKQDIAMQMMYGISGDKHSLCRYYDINREASDMQSRYQGLHIGREIQKIRQSDDKEEVNCILCSFFDLDEKIEIHDDNKNSCTHFVIKEIGTEWTSPMYVKCSGRKHNYKNTHCDLCKLIRHEVINYNDRTHALHWTIGESSNESNVFAEEKDCSRKGEGFSNVFSTEKTQHLSPIQKYNSFFQKIKKLYEGKDKPEAIVLGGFTAIGKELYDLSYNYLIDELRKRAKVSILVFDERGKDLHLNADILIEMRVREDEQSHYIHHELRVAKSDLQRHVYGWHHYKKLRDLSIEVYPNMHALMSHRFASTYALARLERDSFKFPQPLLQKFQDSICSIDKEDRNKNDKHFNEIVKEIKGAPSFEKKKSHFTIDVKEKIDTSTFIQNSENDTILVLLFGKDEIAFYDTVRDEANKPNKGGDMSHIHCWNVRPSDILPEEILVVIRQYMRNWWNNTKEKSTLHIYLDDLAQFWLYPLLVKERNFLPALLSICNEVRYEREFDKPLVIHNVKLHLICSDNESLQYKFVKQLDNWN